MFVSFLIFCKEFEIPARLTGIPTCAGYRYLKFWIRKESWKDTQVNTQPTSSKCWTSQNGL